MNFGWNSENCYLIVVKNQKWKMWIMTVGFLLKVVFYEMKLLRALIFKNFRKQPVLKRFEV